jgi:hypothetical protein
MAKPEYGLASSKAANECAKVPEAPRVKWELGFIVPRQNGWGLRLTFSRSHQRFKSIVEPSAGRVAHAATKRRMNGHMGEKPRKVKSMSHVYHAGLA